MEEVAHFLIKFAIAAGYITAVMYVSAKITFYFFCNARPETPESMNNFLTLYRKILSRAKRDGDPAKTIRSTQKVGYSSAITFGALPMMILADHFPWHLLDILASLGVLYFGGFFMAIGWYGARCLQELKLESPLEASTRP